MGGTGKPLPQDADLPGEVLHPSNLRLLLVYNKLYVLYNNRAKRLLQLFPISFDPSQAKDATLLIKPLDGAGALQLSVVDNLLVLHDPIYHSHSLYDIKLSTDFPVVAPSSLLAEQGDAGQAPGQAQLYAQSWCFEWPRYVLDDPSGTIWCVKLDLDAVALSCDDKPWLMEFLLRRRASKPHVLALLSGAVEAQAPLQQVVAKLLKLANAFYYFIFYRVRDQAGGARAAQSAAEVQLADETASAIQFRQLHDMVALPCTVCNAAAVGADASADADAAAATAAAELAAGGQEALGAPAEPEQTATAGFRLDLSTMEDYFGASQQTLGKSQPPRAWDEPEPEPQPVPAPAAVAAAAAAAAAVPAPAPAPEGPVPLEDPVVDQADILRWVLRPMLDAPDANVDYAVAVILEYVRSLHAHGIAVCSFIYTAAIRALADASPPRFYKLQQLLQYHVLDDDVGVAYCVISIAPRWPQALWYGIDMLHRLGSHNDVVALLLARGQVLRALDYAQRNPSATTPSAHFVEAARCSGSAAILRAVKAAIRGDATQGNAGAGATA